MEVSETAQNNLVTVSEGTKQKNYEEIPVLYLWFGKTVPEDYLILLSQLEYPVIFLKNPKIERKFSRELFDVQKADYYRLWYMYEHGGIYSDFDNTIDYPCLMRILEPYKTQDKLIFMTDNRHTREKTQEITINLIYAPYPKMPILKKMLDAIDDTKQAVWEFAGMKFVGQFQEPIEMQMGECVKHSYDWSWFQASNQVLGFDNEAHPHFIKKMQKKSQILAQKEKLEEKLATQKNYSQFLQKDIRQKSHQKAEFNEQLRQAHKKVLQICPKADQILEKFKKTVEKLQGKQNNSENLNFQTFQKNNNFRGHDEKEHLEEKDRTRLWRKINNLEFKNEKLEYENGMYKLQIYGSVIGLLVILCYLVISGIRKRKNRFRKLESQEERPSSAFE